MAYLQNIRTVLHSNQMARQPQSPTGKPRAGLVQMRATEDERAHWQRLAEQRGLNLSDLMRQALASYTTPDAARPDLHLALALERMCKDAGISSSQAVGFLQALIQRIQPTAEAEGPKAGRKKR